MTSEIRELLDSANELFDAEDYVPALRKYQSAIKIEPNNIEALNGCALSLMHTGKTKFALHFLDRAILVRPGFYAFWLNRGNCLREVKQFQPALSCYQRAAVLSPKEYLTHEKMGELYLQTGNITKALESFD